MQNFPVYDLLKNLCKERGVTIKSVEQQLGFSDGFLKKWKTHRPNIANIETVADYFGVSIDSLCGRTSGEYLSENEIRLLTLFRSMTAEGQSFLLQSAEIASRTYIKSHTVSEEDLNVHA